MDVLSCKDTEPGVPTFAHWVRPVTLMMLPLGLQKASVPLASITANALPSGCQCRLAMDDALLVIARTGPSALDRMSDGHDNCMAIDQFLQVRSGRLQSILHTVILRIITPAHESTIGGHRVPSLYKEGAQYMQTSKQTKSIHNGPAEV